MDAFEEEIRKALARQEPSAAFTANVLAKCAVRRNNRPAFGWWQIGALAAALLMMTSGTWYRQHARAVRGEAAKQQLMVALRIAGVKLQHAQEQVREFDSTEVQQ